MHYVELTKLQPTLGAPFSPSDWRDYLTGTLNHGFSLPNGYTITGFLLETPEVGRCLRILRTSRNGQNIPGIYVSSTITGIGGGLVHTQNSVYRLRYVSLPSGELQVQLSLFFGYNPLRDVANQASGNTPTSEV